MAHVFQPAPSGRAKCRGCGAAIAKGEVRFGERLPNPFAEGEMTTWFHVTCAVYTRPEPFLEATATPPEVTIDDLERLRSEATRGGAYRRLPRLHGAERASTGRARCRSCRKPIEKATWRIPLVFWEEGRFQPGGFIHVRCSAEYFGTTDIVARLRHFSPELDDAAVAEIEDELRSAPPTE